MSHTINFASNGNSFCIVGKYDWCFTNTIKIKSLKSLLSIMIFKFSIVSLYCPTRSPTHTVSCPTTLAVPETYNLLSTSTALENKGNPYCEG